MEPMRRRYVSLATWAQERQEANDEAPPAEGLAPPVPAFYRLFDGETDPELATIVAEGPAFDQETAEAA